MNSTETVKLCAIIRALCPSQKFDAMTPDAWSLVMEDIPFNDAQAAVRTIYRTQGSDAEWVRKIEADDVIREVKRVRVARLAAHPDLIPPPGLTIAEDIEWMRNARRAVGDGREIPDTRGELVDRRADIRLALAAGPVARERKREVAGHEITAAEKNRALAALSEALKDDA